MHACLGAYTALCTQSALRAGIEEHARREPARPCLPGDARLPVIDAQVVLRCELEGAPTNQQPPPVGSEELAGFVEGQVRESIAHGGGANRRAGHATPLPELFLTDKRTARSSRWQGPAPSQRAGVAHQRRARDRSRPRLCSVSVGPEGSDPRHRPSNLSRRHVGLRAHRRRSCGAARRDDHQSNAARRGALAVDGAGRPRQQVATLPAHPVAPRVRTGQPGGGSDRTLPASSVGSMGILGRDEGDRRAFSADRSFS